MVWDQQSPKHFLKLERSKQIIFLECNCVSLRPPYLTRRILSLNLSVTHLVLDVNPNYYHAPKHVPLAGAPFLYNIQA